MADQTAMERWEVWVESVASGVPMPSEFHDEMRYRHGIRLALEAASAGDLVAELRRRGVLEGSG